MCDRRGNRHPLTGILGLQPEHFNFDDGVCFVLRGKGSRGSGYRKRVVPLTPLLKETMAGFLKIFPREKGSPVFQNRKGGELSKNTAHHWLDELIGKIKVAGFPFTLKRGLAGMPSGAPMFGFSLKRVQIFFSSSKMAAGRTQAPFPIT